MSDWREQLNRLAVEFWCGVGDPLELSVLADAANAEMGEVHPDIWDLYVSPTTEQATYLLLKIATDVNGFHPKSWVAEPFAVGALKKALGLFLAQELSVQSLCKLVNLLDAVFVIDAGKDMGSKESSPFYNIPWLGDLWNSCDWCDETWTFDKSPHLVLEARRVLEMMANPAFNATCAKSRAGRLIPR